MLREQQTHGHIRQTEIIHLENECFEFHEKSHLTNIVFEDLHKTLAVE